ncbi:CorA family divalent cation transporter [Acidithiobacillus ferrivorans]|uniref:Magnesium transporter n=2 Tax=Acidithiobacillus ferrivorans TaxID=160808 RepID=A0A7T5BHL7_9PROT|nr:CorA family divalent cation transporter [Acidithiobacillus ferrivorans]MBN6742148.1 magnesium transporter [Acidithiobacillus sp. MC6.1]QQD72730.1 magnesium transporter [Acidithiobacillus ferrivorans]
MMRITRDCLLSGNANRRSWMALVAPSANELTQAAMTLDIPESFLRKRLEGEASRPLIKEERLISLQFQVPLPKEGAAGQFTLVPLSLYFVPGYFVTLAEREIPFLSRLIDPRKPRKRWELVLRIIAEVTRNYLPTARSVAREMAVVERDLRQAQRHDVVYRGLDINDRLLALDLGLLQLEYVVSEIGHFLPAEDAGLMEIHEDTRIELSQVRDQVDSDQATINELLESYAYVVHNNVNHLFKFMAALIILATIPLFIPGAAAMNVPLGPFPHWRYGFAAVTGGLVLVEVLTAWVFYRKGWLRLD